MVSCFSLVALTVEICQVGVSTQDFATVEMKAPQKNTGEQPSGVTHMALMLCVLGCPQLKGSVKPDESNLPIKKRKHHRIQKLIFKV